MSDEIPDVYANMVDENVTDPVPDASPPVDAEEEAEPQGAAEEEGSDGATGADTADLPDDPEELRRLAVEQKAEIERLAKANSGIFEEMRTTRKDNQKLSGRLDKLESLFERAVEEGRKAPATPAAEEAEVPDPDLDPVGAARFEAKKAADRVEQLSEELKKERTERKQTELLEAMEAEIEADETAFASSHEDWTDASEHWGTVVLKQHELAGVPVETEDQQVAVLSNAEMSLYAIAKRQGKSVSALKHEQAKVWGFQPKPAAKAKPAEGEEDEPAPSVADKRRQKRAERTKSLDTLGGGATKGGPGKGLKAALSEAADEAEYNLLLDRALESTGLDERTLLRMMNEDKL